MIAISLAVLVLQSASLPTDNSDLRGTAGICVRWTSDPRHVADAIVVKSSGNLTLDQALPETIRNMEWPAPASPAYKGEWVGIVMSVAGGEVDQPLPNCDGLPLPATRN